MLDQVMDIQYFARGVMATYASARVYKSADRRRAGGVSRSAGALRGGPETRLDGQVCRCIAALRR